LAISGGLVFAFDGFELDTARFELRMGDAPVHVEPQVLSLLILLAKNRERMVSKDELIDTIWDGRIVSESAVAARIKAARKAIGDDGSAQRLIRTVHGKGFRFVGDVVESGGSVAAAPAATIQLISEAQSAETITNALRTARDGRPSIAVLPFQLLGEPGAHDIVADALPADIIMDLSRLHWLFVIARGSSFRFRGDDVDPVVVARELAVRYCVTGTIELVGSGVTITVSLTDSDGGTIWAEQYRGALHELQQMRSEIEQHVVTSLAVQIPQNEVRLARRRPAIELDAWASFHLGLDHMYRFNRQDNAQAAALFSQSLERDPYFSGALGGLSFTHFQSAFMRFADDPAAEVEQARALAQQAVEADRLDPFAHFNVGRCSWLEGRLEDSIDWFDRATSLSPSFAQGVYTRGLVAVMAGKAEQADADLALAFDLSPLDPLAYGMVSGRALAQLQLGDLAKAEDLAVKAALMPGAHKHIALIAAMTSHIVGKGAEAQHWLARAKQADPAINAEVFFASFPFAQNSARDTLEKNMRELGL